MAVADVYDALVTERPYKKLWTHEQAVEEIIKNKGIAFDPIVIEAFVLEQDHFKEVLERYRDN
jgi:HD-GYP domain-containing protein (c-di-GMP phosphodiesterase class II)